MNIETEGGKYCTTIDDHGIIRVSRYNSPWREICGDGYVLSLLAEIESTRNHVSELNAMIAKLADIVAAAVDE